jgi:hypothetical protein
MDKPIAAPINMMDPANTITAFPITFDMATA